MSTPPDSLDLYAYDVAEWRAYFHAQDNMRQLLRHPTYPTVPQERAGPPGYAVSADDAETIIAARFGHG